MEVVERPQETVARSPVYIVEMIRLIAGFLLFASTGAAAATVEERLAALETQVQELRRENAELRQALGLEAKAAPAPAAAPAAARPSAETATAVTVGGLVQAQTEIGDRGDSRFSDDNDRVYLRRARINVSGSVLEDFDFRIETELAGTLANSSGLRASLTDGYVDWTRYPAATVRLGQFKSGYGFEHLYSDQRLSIPERSLASDRLAFGRQLGIQAMGDLLGERLSYMAGAFNGNGANNSGNDDEGFLTVARVAAVPFERGTRRWALGVNGYRTEEANAGERTGWGADTQLTAGPFELWAEYLASSATVDAGGGYIQAAYYLIPKRLQAAARWERFDPNTALGPDTTTGTWLGLNYHLKGNDLKLQLFYFGTDSPGLENQHKVVARVQTVF